MQTVYNFKKARYWEILRVKWIKKYKKRIYLDVAAVAKTERKTYDKDSQLALNLNEC